MLPIRTTASNTIGPNNMYTLLHVPLPCRLKYVSPHDWPGSGIRSVVATVQTTQTTTSSRSAAAHRNAIASVLMDSKHNLSTRKEERLATMMMVRGCRYTDVIARKR